MNAYKSHNGYFKLNAMQKTWEERAQESLDKLLWGKEVYGLSTKHTALKALTSFTCESKLVCDSKEPVKLLASNKNHVDMFTVLGKCRYKTRSHSFLLRTWVFGLASSYLRMEVRKWEKI